MIERKVPPGKRRVALKKCLNRAGYARILECHSGLSGIIAEAAKVDIGGKALGFDGLWESSLTDSGTKGLPDASIVGFDSRIHTVNEIMSVTSKPIIVDGDTGGEPCQFEYLVQNLERLGVSAVVIEDKVYPKRNSLDSSANQDLEDPRVFAEKIIAGKEVGVTNGFMIIARLESLIAGAGIDDALDRAEKYIVAGADGIMIHSNKPEPDEILEFAGAYQGLCDRVGRRPALVCVPTTYNTISDAQLASKGFNIIIHANHMLRAAYKGMEEVAASILANGRSFEADRICAPVPDVLSSVGFHRITQKDRERAETRRQEDARWDRTAISAGQPAQKDGR